MSDRPTPVYDIIPMEEVQAARNRQRHVLSSVFPVKDVRPLRSVLKQGFAQVSTLRHEDRTEVTAVWNSSSMLARTCSTKPLQIHSGPKTL